MSTRVLVIAVAASSKFFKVLKLSIRLMFGMAVLLLTACDKLDEYISSGGEQDLTRFTPSVAPLATNTTNNSNPTPTNNEPDTNSSVPLLPSGSGGGDDAASSNNDSESSGGSNNNSPSLASTGIIWKPVSEGDGRLVVLTPTSYGTPSITILDQSGRAVETGDYVGHTNGNRATYRFSRSGNGYTSPAYLSVNGQAYLVSNTSARYN